MPPPRLPRLAGWSTRTKVIVVLAALVIAPPLIARIIWAGRGGVPSSSSTPAASPTTLTASAAASPAASPNQTVTGKPAPHSDPTFSLAGNPGCAITYGSRPDGRMYWKADLSGGGELLTFAHDTAGDFYRFDIWVTPGTIIFVAPQPLWKIDNVGGFLYPHGVPVGFVSTMRNTIPCSIAPTK